MSSAGTISSPPLLEEGTLCKLSQEDVKAMYEKFNIPQTVTIRAIDKTCDVKTENSLRSGEIFILLYGTVSNPIPLRLPYPKLLSCHPTSSNSSKSKHIVGNLWFLYTV